jgi:hypothetical protein
MTHLTGFHYMMLVFVGGSPNTVSQEARSGQISLGLAGNALDVNRYVGNVRNNHPELLNSA